LYGPGDGGFEELIGGGAGSGLLGFELVHQGHQLVHHCHDPALSDKERERLHDSFLNTHLASPADTTSSARRVTVTSLMAESSECLAKSAVGL
jgi:hypothetical protein